ncbi:probable 2-oxoglutarate-dependent dioxygenase SLC1 [Musa acuminata AAA Group]|uniref:probable 2-oxoglutarate-dependent dioxygenase SLC1 n=1 Tax=Musa acuminata AAA Group TaxID=214697 RepID=UPI0031E4417F
MVAMDVVVGAGGREEETADENYVKGVRHLCESGISRVPAKYILPVPDRPQVAPHERKDNTGSNLRLPVIDVARLRTPDRGRVLECLDRACREYGFFQVVNHGMSSEALRRIMDVGRRFFGLPLEERSKYMTSDIRGPVRYGTSYNQIQDSVFCWRDFLKLSCHPLEEVLPFWPSAPMDLRDEAVSYAKQIKSLFCDIMAAVLEILGVNSGYLEEFDDGTHLVVINYYPPCPEPDLTLGMPPHSDYGFLTLLLQDHIKGLQVQLRGKWITVEPIPNSFVVNIGDHLEIFSNGRYKSVLHRVVVNSTKPRMSIASLHSLPFASVVSPSPELVDRENPRQYKDTDFAAFLDYISSHEPKRKSFLESRKLPPHEVRSKSQ